MVIILFPAKKELKFLFRTDEYIHVGWIMVINSFYAQIGVKAYSQQQSIGSRMAKLKNLPVIPQDQIEISGEGRKKCLADKISREIVNNLTKNSKRDPAAQEILKKLGQEFGAAVDVFADPQQGLAFKVSGKNAEEIGDISPAESDWLRKRIFDIAQSVAYDHLS